MLAQRRNVYLDDIEPIIEVGPEFTFFGERFKIFICRADYPHVNFYALVAANALERPRFEEAEEFYLCCGVNFANFIKKNCAAVCCFKPAYPSVHCAGKSAFFVAEQLAFKEVRWYCGAVHRYKRLFSARRRCVDKVCD